MAPLSRDLARRRRTRSGRAACGWLRAPRSRWQHRRRARKNNCLLLLAEGLAQAGRDAPAVLRAQLQTGQPAPLAPLYRPSVQPYLVSWFRHDPAHEIAKLKMPVAIVQGETDIQVSVADDARRLAAALPSAELKLVPGMNHVLKTAAAGDIKAYMDAGLPLSAGLMDFLVGFLRRASTPR